MAICLDSHSYRGVTCLSRNQELGVTSVRVHMRSTTQPSWLVGRNTLLAAADVVLRKSIFIILVLGPRL